MADTELKRYVRQKKLGAGAMGEVWLATDTLLNRPVAIKQLKATEDVRPKKFFLSEAQMLASLNHPNITLIYDAVFDEDHHRYYLIMEYVEGKSLESLLADWNGPLPLDIILDIAIGVLQALEYAHQRDIVHRDIKPANVIIQEQGVKLTDFGVAGLMSVLAEGSDYIVGTPAYMSPEQIEGEAIDGRADLYSLGVMLYNLASGGYQPFEYSNLDEIFEAHLEADPIPLSEYASGVPLAFEHTVMRLLAKEPDDRYPSASAVLDIFKAIQARQKFSQSYLQLLDPEARPLVGRAGELARMEAIWTECQAAAAPHLLVIQGEMGLGKSRLITEFLGRSVVDKGFVAVAGRCDESGIPYAPFAEILAAIFNKGLAKSKPTQKQVEQLMSHIPSLGRLLDIPAGLEPGEEVPQAPRRPATPSSGLWATLGSRVPENAAGDPFQNEWQFFATIMTILTELGPVALFLENATFLDEASAALARFLIGQAQSPLLLIAACRETGQPLPWLESFSADQKVVITLPPLSTAAVQEQLSHLLDGPVSDEIAGLINERGRGNPLNIEEITRQLIDSQELHQTKNGEWRYTPSAELAMSTDSFLPKSVLSAFARRVDKLSDASREALALAALLEPGPEFEFDLWVTLLGGEAQAESARRILEEALNQRLVRRLDGNRYAFRPADVGKALAATLSETRRREAHRQIAEILHPEETDPILVGYHFEQAGLAAEATRYLEMAGARAMATQATHAALAYYKRAVTLVESQSAYKALGQLYRQNGERSNSVRAYERALEFAQEAGDIAGQAEILNGLSLTSWLFDRYKKAYQYAASVLNLAGSPKSERAIAQAHLGTISWLVGQLDEAENWCQKSIMTLRGSKDEASLAGVHNRLGQVYFSQGKLAEAQTAFQYAAARYEKLADKWGQGHCLINLGKVATDRGDFEQASSLFNAAQQLFETVNNRDGYMAVFAQRGRNLLSQGRPDDALPLLAKALHIALEKGKRSAYILSNIYLLIAWASLEKGEINRAKTVTHDALKLVEAAGNQEYIALGRATLAQIYAAEGDRADAEATFQKALALFEQIGSRPGLVRARLSYAHFLAQQGQAAGAAALEKEARVEAAELGLHLPQAQKHY